MYEVLKAEIKPKPGRIGIAHVKIGKLILDVEICVYMDQNLWIRIPEMWLSRDQKKRFAWFENKEDSDEFQIEVLKKIFDMIGLTLEKGIQIRKEFLETRKQLTKNKNKLTLDKDASGL